MKTITKLAFITFTFFSLAANAQGPSQNASKASKHSVKALGYGTASTAQVASAVIAVPVLAVGSVGVVSYAVGESLLNAASVTTDTTDKCEPLEISERTVTADQPPQQILNPNSILN